ncbi:MAG: NAD(P)H-dependent oxidoreductase subunit E [Bacteroidetes bacterium]|nr:NAD(P)H-dependent oxidoreductase subunit E [Bacteroidota bacterium]
MKKQRESQSHIVDRIIAIHGRSMEAVIPILQDIQKEFNYLPEEALRHVCSHTDITPSAITGVSTFYSHFRSGKAGEHIIRVCTGTACHVKGALNVYDALCRELKLAKGEVTDPQGKFTLEKVSCLGCCTLAPVVKIDDITYGHLKTDKVGEMLHDFLTRQYGLKKQRNHRKKSVETTLGEIRIGLGSCCIASVSEAVKAELEKTLWENQIHVDVKQVGCVGICHQVPVLEVVKPGGQVAFYAKVKPEEVREVVLNHFRPEGFFSRLRMGFSGMIGNLLEEGIPRSFQRYDQEQRETPLQQFLEPQLAIATEDRGVMIPCDLEDFQHFGGFRQLKYCLDQLTPQQVIDEISLSGLRGRGGAGFPTGRKWQLVKDQASSGKYVICNGDEGDPGAFMDRMLLESYPLRIIEGMLIAAYATGANHGIFYIRAEYPLAVRRVKEAIHLCREKGIIGPSILGSAFSFEIEIFEGAGAFICGEETALIASVEGRRGHPSLRPPYPAFKGLHQKPTLVNNTETLSLISWIIRHGAKTFAVIGTPRSKGTKVFALAGKVRFGGLIEVPMGITIRQIVEDIGGGTIGHKFKAVQIGGPSGGCVPASHAGLPIDFEELITAGSMMGSGGLIVLDESDCMVDIAHYFLSFTQQQSCGKCTFCRVGTRRMLDLLEKFRHGSAREEDLHQLERLAASVKQGSLCGLGKTAPNPVLSALRYFRKEFEAHIQGHCPAGKCQPLITYHINETCIGCTICARQCPASAIENTPYEMHHIDVEKCIKCDICRQCCPVDAITVR